MTPATLRNLLDTIRRTSGIPVIMGPTATGKSELAYVLAAECGGEIVSADSMQFYRGDKEHHEETAPVAHAS